MTRYSEKLRPSPATWLLVPIGGVLAAASTIPLGALVAVGAGLVACGIVVAVLLAGTPAITVDDNAFGAGRARLPLVFVGEVESLDAEQTRTAMGPDLRADAHVVHRAWVRTAVRVGVDDAADPTPYWLVSTRRPAELAAALVAGRDASGRDAAGPGSQTQAAHSEHTGRPFSS